MASTCRVPSTWIETSARAAYERNGAAWDTALPAVRCAYRAGAAAGLEALLRRIPMPAPFTADQAGDQARRAALVDQLIAAYDKLVRANTTPTYDALAAVAQDDEGYLGVQGETHDLAERLGLLPAEDSDEFDPFRQALRDATSAYQEQLRAECSSRPFGHQAGSA